MQKIRFLFLLMLTSSVLFCQVKNTHFQRNTYFFDVNTTDYKLHDGDGERSFIFYIEFEEKFDDAPKVFIGVSTIDIELDGMSHLAYGVEALGINDAGFTLKIRVWGDTRIKSIGGYWDAYYN